MVIDFKESIDWGGNIGKLVELCSAVNCFIAFSLQSLSRLGPRYSFQANYASNHLPCYSVVCAVICNKAHVDWNGHHHGGRFHSALINTNLFHPWKQAWSWNSLSNYWTHVLSCGEVRWLKSTFKCSFALPNWWQASVQISGIESRHEELHVVPSFLFSWLYLYNTGVQDHARQYQTCQQRALGNRNPTLDSETCVLNMT